MNEEHEVWGASDRWETKEAATYKHAEDKEINVCCEEQFSYCFINTVNLIVSFSMQTCKCVYIIDFCMYNCI